MNIKSNVGTNTVRIGHCDGQRDQTAPAVGQRCMIVRFDFHNLAKGSVRPQPCAVKTLFRARISSEQGSPVHMPGPIEQAGKGRLELRSGRGPDGTIVTLPKAIHGRYFNAIDQHCHDACFVIVIVHSQ
ncbi:hypothetical protein [Massilia aquatica]|uniref:Uncharacterized protein n=1 Tax=Massilia aquatica TaxID=2609000 RepID=A0ABX0M386_9BURK|nr:hypothetical protein [Massilia aquatica]NHZ40704.1 hypothetical protein [Massilia aquatica]